MTSVSLLAVATILPASSVPRISSIWPAGMTLAVLPRSRSIGGDKAWRFRPAKKMHVSPFIGMDVDYDWSFTFPSDRNNVFMANSKNGERFFDAAMMMKRKEISAASLARVLVAFPLLTVKIVAAIYWQALRLWLKRTPLYVHPRKKKTVTVRT